MFLIAAIILGVIFVLVMGSLLVAPANHPIKPPPADLHAEDVQFPSASGATLHGWFVAGQPGRGAIILMHGVHADRTVMLSRAEFLSRAGYAVLLFDFQGHGESPGKRITFGHLESRDATAAVNYLRQRLPAEKIGVIGVSLGGASVLLADPPLPVSALIVESSYPTIYAATRDRMEERFGFLGWLATPLLTYQMKPRLGISLNDLKPIERVKTITTPKFFIAGTTDPLTRVDESRALFAAAAEPKQLWLVDGAGHIDMYGFAGAEYKRRVLEFLAANLN